jgi:hypothetical protein
MNNRDCKVIYHNNLPGNNWCVLSNTAPKDCGIYSKEIFYAYAKPPPQIRRIL